METQHSKDSCSSDAHRILMSIVIAITCCTRISPITPLNRVVSNLATRVRLRQSEDIKFSCLRIRHFHGSHQQAHEAMIIDLKVHSAACCQAPEIIIITVMALYPSHSLPASVRLASPQRLRIIQAKNSTILLHGPLFNGIVITKIAMFTYNIRYLIYFLVSFLVLSSLFSFL